MLKPLGALILTLLASSLLVVMIIGGKPSQTNTKGSNPIPEPQPSEPTISASASNFGVHFLNARLEEGYTTLHISRGSLETMTVAVDRIGDETVFKPLVYVSDEVFTVDRDEDKLTNYMFSILVKGMGVELDPPCITFDSSTKRSYTELIIQADKDLKPGTYWLTILVPEDKGFGTYALRIIAE